jgi:hypothetical protein
MEIAISSRDRERVLCVSTFRIDVVQRRSENGSLIGWLVGLVDVGFGGDAPSSFLLSWFLVHFRCV